MAFQRPLSGGGNYTLAADTVVTVEIPPRARRARLVIGQNVNYTLGGTSPSNTVGFPLSSGTRDIDVAGDELKLFETGGATTAYVEFYGADVQPAPVRIKDAHHSFTATGVSDLSTAVRTQATHMMVRANQPFRFTVDGTDPTATIGVYVAANTTVNIPCGGGTVKVIRTTSNSTRYQVQAFENRLTGGNVYEQNVFYPLDSSTTENFVIETRDVSLPPDTVVTDVVPANATTAVVTPTTEIHYTTDGSEPSQTDGTDLAADTPVTLTVSPGDELKFYETGSAVSETVSIIYYNTSGLQIDVPNNAVWAWISAAGQDIKYSVNGVDPSSTRGFTITTTGNAKVPVPAGTSNLRLLASTIGATATILFFSR